MGQSQLRLDAVGPGFEQAAFLQALDGRHRDDRFEDREREWLADGHQFQGRFLLVVQAGQAGLDQVTQPGRGGERALEPPHGVADLQDPRFERPLNELSQEEDVARAGVDQLAQRRRLDRAAELVGGDLAHRARGQRVHLDAHDPQVLPHVEGATDTRGAQSHGEDHEDRLRVDHLVEQRHRRIVEFVGVVHHDDQAVALPGGQHLIHRAKDRPFTFERDIEQREQRRQRGEGHLGGARGGAHHRGRESAFACQFRGAAGERALADAGRTDQRHATGGGVRQGPRDRREFCIAPDELLIRRHGRSVSGDYGLKDKCRINFRGPTGRRRPTAPAH